MRSSAALITKAIVSDNLSAVEKLRSKAMPKVKRAIMGLLDPVRSLPPEAMATTILSDRDKWIQTISQQYQTIGTTFANRTAQQLQSQVKSPDFSTDLQKYKAGVQAFIDTYSQQRVPSYVDLIVHSFQTHLDDLLTKKAKATPKTTPIDDTTDEEDNTDSEDEEESGEIVGPNFDNLIDNVLTVGGLMVAGSAVVLASGLGALAGANAFSTTTDTEVVKVWQAIEDSHTRPDHSDADGQEVALDEPFNVGSDQMLFPLDDSMGAGADQILNCRCVVGFNVNSTMRADRHLDWPERLDRTIAGHLHLVMPKK